MQTISSDVLVIGAGPAGSAAACVLADAGLDVALVDRAGPFRDKVCGDALIPDALAALDALRLKARVLARSRELQACRLYAPDGQYIAISGACASVPRRALDDLLREAAVARGAAFLPHLNLIGALTEGERVVGARFARRDEPAVAIRAHATLLATGASGGPLQLFGIVRRPTPSATAARVYFEVEEAVDREFDHLCVSFDQAICPGYGWIFPGPDRLYNVGVGYFYDTRQQPRDSNLRRLLDRFLATFPPARHLSAHARPVTELRGAPLRTGLGGAALSRPGLLVVGEAAGLTYPLTGEGIGKSLASGMMAAEIVAEGLRAAAFDPDAVARTYAHRLSSTLTDRFRAYQTAQRWASHPRLLNFLTRRANRGRYVRAQIEGLWNETSDPRALLSTMGLVRALLM